jgi:hypothetical protein
VEQVFTLIVEKQDAVVMKSPSRTPVSIVSIPKDGSWRQLLSPATPDFFATFSEFLGDCPVPEGWKHFRGQFYAGPDGKFGCIACGVEAVSSNDGCSFLCPKRGQYGDIKGFVKAQEKGCFAIIRKKILECIEKQQDAVCLFNSGPSRVLKNPAIVKPSDAFALEILGRKKQKTETL